MVIRNSRLPRFALAHHRDRREHDHREVENQADQRGHDLHGRAPFRVVVEPEGQGHVRLSGFGAGRRQKLHQPLYRADDGRIAGIDHELRQRTVAVTQAALEIRRDVEHGAQVAAPHLVEQFGHVARPADEILNLACLQGTHELPRHRCVRVVHQPGGHVTHVGVDGVAEQDDLDERQSHDHSQRQPLAKKLAYFLVHDRRCPPEPEPHQGQQGGYPGQAEHEGPPKAHHDERERPPEVHRDGLRKLVAATNTSSSVAPVRPTAPCSDACFSRESIRSTGDSVSGSSMTRRRLPSWVTARTQSFGASNARVRLGHPGCDFDRDRFEPVHQLLRRAFPHHHAPVEKSEAVAAFRFVHEVGGDKDGRALVGQFEQAVPEIPPALRVHRAGGFVQQQQPRFVQRDGRQGQSLLLAAAQGSGEA